MNLRDNIAVTWVNNIIIDHSGYAVSVETLSSGVGSVDRLNAGDLKLINNIWYDFGLGDTITTIGKEEYTGAHLAANNNVMTDPMLMGVSRTNNHKLDPRPQSGSPVYSNLAAIPNDGFFTHVNHKGAFGNYN